MVHTIQIYVFQHNFHGACSRLSLQQSNSMATVSFSVPEDVERAFNEVFAGQDKSAVIADLMRQAVEREQRKARSRAAIERPVELRATAPARSTGGLRASRTKGRP
jgi:hypothetical protein